MQTTQHMMLNHYNFDYSLKPCSVHTPSACGGVVDLFEEKRNLCYHIIEDLDFRFHSSGTLTGACSIVYENEGKREFRNSKSNKKTPALRSVLQLAQNYFLILGFPALVPSSIQSFGVLFAVLVLGGEFIGRMSFSSCFGEFF